MKSDGEIITTIKAVERTSWGLASCGLAVGLLLGLALPWRAGVALAALAAFWGAWRTDTAGSWRRARLRQLDRAVPAVPAPILPLPGRGAWTCGYCDGSNDPAFTSCGHCGAAPRL